ncbi:S8 family peptidase [Tepidibacter aestuarii]|uniref:S8 family peptidase n=1 Tax=Tepidibacter aestuarii TaxID=2925782 RepID=UPI0020C0A858|nr:S8 family peptidase [Tepidibacter aestuarii]CAH2213226.1 intracellular serine protease [Tepidibacter aestuarii]
MSEVKLIPYKLEDVTKENIETMPQGVEMIHAPEIWDKANRGKDVVIAIIDTGCDRDHPDLKDRIIDGRNFTTDHGNDLENYDDNEGHGTHVAGTIAASMNNNFVVGVAPEAKLLILKALSGDGSGTYEWIINSIKYAIDWQGPNGEKVKVINMSLGGTEDNHKLYKVIKEAVDNNISVVCAAGNSGDGNYHTNEYEYPGSYNEVIQVGAVNFEGNFTNFANSNNEVDLVAPGVGILSTYPNNTVTRLTGTSMAAPHVAGAIALLNNSCKAEFARELSEAEIYGQLIKHTVSLGHNKKFEGNGLLSLN